MWGSNSYQTWYHRDIKSCALLTEPARCPVFPISYRHLSIVFVFFCSPLYIPVLSFLREAGSFTFLPSPFSLLQIHIFWCPGDCNLILPRFQDFIAFRISLPILLRWFSSESIFSPEHLADNSYQSTSVPSSTIILPFMLNLPLPHFLAYSAQLLLFTLLSYKPFPLCLSYAVSVVEIVFGPSSCSSLPSSLASLYLLSERSLTSHTETSLVLCCLSTYPLSLYCGPCTTNMLLCNYFLALCIVVHICIYFQN